MDNGKVVLLAHGRATAMVLAYRTGKQRFPAKLLSKLMATIAGRMKAVSAQG